MNTWKTLQKWKTFRISQKNKSILLAVLVAALVAVPFIITDKYILHIIIACFIYSCLALSLNLIIGLSGQFSLGHVTFYGLGAYITALLMMRLNMSFWIAMVISAVCVGTVGCLLALPTLNLRGDYIAVVTLGFGEVFRLILVNAIDVTRGPMGLPNIPKPTIGSFVFDSKIKFYFLGLIIMILVIIFMKRLTASGFGMAMLSMKEDEIAAAAIGINPIKYKLWAFVIGAVIAGVMGSFYAVFMGFISPSSFQYSESISMVSMVVLGGLGGIPGSIIGAVVLTVLPEVLRTFSQYRMIIFGAAMVIMMIFKPNGIWGLDKRVRNIYKRNNMHVLKMKRGAKDGKSASSI